VVMDTPKYLLCPDCNRKGVYLKLLPNGEDNYRCRYRDCGFYFYCQGTDQYDKKNEARLLECNMLEALP